MATGLLQRRTVEVGGAAFDAVLLGEGDPTVVFVNGLGSPLEEWALVAPSVAERTRVLCYDRRTAPPKGPVPAHDATQIAGDLHELLAALGVKGPLVLVGHSWGGAVSRRYAADHPGDVAGLVLVDASHEGMKAMIPKRPRVTLAIYRATTLPLRVRPLRRRLLRMLGFDRLSPAAFDSVCDLGWVADGRTGQAEYAGIGPSLQELMQIAPELPPVPTRVLLAGGRPGLAKQLSAKQLATVRAVWDKAVAGRSHVALQVVPDSGHYISLDAPQTVIDAIDDVVSQVSRRAAATG